MAAASPAGHTDEVELTVDELARRAEVPVRTIREYQTLGLLPGPERRGRVGIYRRAHLTRLELIGRLQQRGYSLAGIGDLLASWRGGADLGEVLGLAADQLVHFDEPGAPASLDQLAHLLPDLVPARLDDLLAVGIVEMCGPERCCVPSPSLLQLTIDLLAAGYPADRVLGLLRTIHQATAAVAATTVDLLADRPPDLDPDRFVALAARGRGLLAHGTGRLTIHTIGRLLDLADDADTPSALRHLAGER
jgi:DNA-binding transcriptional MerR regulator